MPLLDQRPSPWYHHLANLPCDWGLAVVLGRDSTQDNSTPPVLLPSASVEKKAAGPSVQQKVKKKIRQPAQQQIEAGAVGGQAGSRKRRSTSPAISEQVWVPANFLKLYRCWGCPYVIEGYRGVPDTLAGIHSI